MNEEEQELLKFLENQRHQLDSIRSIKHSKEEETRKIKLDLEYQKRLLDKSTKSESRNQKTIISLKDKYGELMQSKQEMQQKQKQYIFLDKRYKKIQDDNNREIEDLKRNKAYLEKDILNLYDTQLQLKSKESELAGSHQKKLSEATEEMKTLEYNIDTMRLKLKQAARINRRRAERQAQRIEIQKKIHKSLGDATDDKLRKLKVTDNFFKSILTNTLQKNENKSSVLEAAFMKIKASCGLADVSKIVQKFLNRGNTKIQLEQNLVEAKYDLEEKLKENKDLEKILSSFQVGGLSNQGNRELYRELDELRRTLQLEEKEVDLIVEKRRKSEIICQLIKQTIIKLLSSLDSSNKVDIDSIYSDENTMMHLFNHCEHLTAKLLKSVKLTYNNHNHNNGSDDSSNTVIGISKSTPGSKSSAGHIFMKHGNEVDDETSAMVSNNDNNDNNNSNDNNNNNNNDNNDNNNNDNNNNNNNDDNNNSNDNTSISADKSNESILESSNIISSSIPGKRSSMHHKISKRASLQDLKHKTLDLKTYNGLDDNSNPNHIDINLTSDKEVKTQILAQHQATSDFLHRNLSEIEINDPDFLVDSASNIRVKAKFNETFSIHRDYNTLSFSKHNIPSPSKKPSASGRKGSSSNNNDSNSYLIWYRQQLKSNSLYKTKTEQRRLSFIEMQFKSSHNGTPTASSSPKPSPLRRRSNALRSYVKRMQSSNDLMKQNMDNYNNNNNNIRKRISNGASVINTVASGSDRRTSNRSQGKLRKPSNVPFISPTRPDKSKKRSSNLSRLSSFNNNNNNTSSSNKKGNKSLQINVGRRGRRGSFVSTTVPNNHIAMATNIAVMHTISPLTAASNANNTTPSRYRRRRSSIAG